MSRIRRVARILAAIAALGVLEPAGAGAQELREYERRLDEHSAAAADAQRTSARVRDSVRRAIENLHSVVVGPMHMLVAPSLEASSRAAAREVMDGPLGRYGSLLDVFTRYVVVVRTRELAWGTVVELTIRDSTGRLISMPHETLEFGRLSRPLLGATLVVLRREVDPELSTWLFGAIPVDPPDPREPARARLDLVSASSPLGRQCYEGDLAACAAVLGLTAEPGAPTRRLVPSGRRIGLVHLALELGGPGAMERLMRTPGSPTERLAAASAMPVDSLLSVWIERVHDPRANPSHMSLGMAAGSLAWMVLFAGLSFRSSRWR